MDPRYPYTVCGNTYNLHLSEIREVWAIVSDEPGISLRGIARRTGIGYGKAVAIFEFLVEGGTILVEKPRKGGTARVSIPLITKRM